MTPNLFSYATSELSQDAFFAWLFAWADKKYSGQTLNAVALSFLNYILNLHNKPPIDETNIVVRKQNYRVDIVIEIGERYILLVEDKIHAKESDDQLPRYFKVISDAYPGREILPVFLKTGDQSNYKSAIDAGFVVCHREQILEAFSSWQGQVENAIFTDFVSNLSEINDEVNAYKTKPVDTWTNQYTPWIGFYRTLQKELPFAVDWDYVPTPTGGFIGAWWLFEAWRDETSGLTHDVYLQIEQGPLCFKIAVAEGENDKRSLRERWRVVLMNEAARSGFELMRPNRLGHGTWMTVARVELNSWLLRDTRGFVDLEQTITLLDNFTKLINRAAASSNNQI